MSTNKKNQLAGFKDPWRLASLPEGAPLAVALSGGADSVALLSLLCEHEGVHAVHVHHGIRGEEADRDAHFCAALAKKLGVPFSLLRVNVPQHAKETGESLETAARNARYAALAAWMRREGISLLATAHHADDQLETMLQHLLRGSGTRGLCGIPAARPMGEGLWVVRPLLSVSKEALLALLAERGLSYVTDSTNGEPCCERNRLRLQIIPLLKELRPTAPLDAAHCAERLAQDEAYLDGIASDFLRQEGREPSVAALRELADPILVRVLRRLMPSPPTARHIDLIRRLLDTERRHADLSVPPHTVVSVESGRLRIREKSPSLGQPFLLPVRPGENRIPQTGALVILGACPEELHAAAAHTYRYTTRIDLNTAEINGALMLRPRRPGDVILSHGMHKAVRRLAGTLELPPRVRAEMPLLVDDRGVLAVPFGALRDGAGTDTDTHVTFYFN